MRNKELISRKIEQLSNSLSILDASMSTGTPINELKRMVEVMQERLADMQTLINTESESWN